MIEPIAATTLAMIRAVFRQHPTVREVRLFGSRAKGTHTDRSDIDLALVGKLTPMDSQAIASELDNLPLPHKFDVQVFEALPTGPLQDHILRVGLEVYPGIAPELPSETGDTSSVKVIEDAYRGICDGSTEPWSALSSVSPEGLRAVVVLGLLETNGSYKELARLFHVDPGHYRRLLDFLRHRNCIIDAAPFRRMQTMSHPGKPS